MKPPLNNLLVDLWLQKRNTLQQLWTLEEQQMVCIDRDHMDDLLEVLATKQKLLWELQAVDTRLRAMAPDMTGDSLLTDPENEAQDTPLTKLVRECRELLLKIIRAEQACEGVLRKKRDAVMAELAHLHDATQARTAYLDHDPPAGGGMDVAL